MPSFNFDGAVIRVLYDHIQAQLVKYFGFNDADLNISQNNQPSRQYSGARDDTEKYQIFITRVSSGTKIGQGFHQVKNETSGYIDRTYEHMVPAVYQFDFLADADLTSDTDYEANDLAQIVSHLVNQLDFIHEMTALGIYIEKGGEIRPSYIVNDSELFEMNPSFDLNLSYNSEYVKALPQVVSIDGITEQV